MKIILIIGAIAATGVIVYYFINKNKLLQSGQSNVPINISPTIQFTPKQCYITINGECISYSEAIEQGRMFY